MGNTEILSDKMAVLQVLGNLLNNPLLLANKEYSLVPSDFPERFHQVLFGAIEYLSAQGMSKISAMDIDQFLVKYTVQYKVFSDNKGLSYVARCSQIAEEGQFGYYYNVLKKYSLLNELAAQGFDITEVFDNSLTDPVAITEQQNKFDTMTVSDILALFEVKLISISQKFEKSSDMISCGAGDSLQELKEELKKTPDMGLPCCSPKFTTIARGRRLKKFYMGSSYQGGGKSRECAGEACHLAVPYYYNTLTEKWQYTGLHESVLYISIELEPDELQTLFMAYVSGVPEDHILDGKYQPGEEVRVDQAIKHIQDSNLKIVRISNFNVDDIEKVIKMYKQKYNTRYIFYDYIGTSTKILAEASYKTGVKGLREDQILLMLASRIKDLCNNLNIHVHAMTQINGEWKTAQEADQNLLRSAKSLADKPDIAYISLPVRDSDSAAIETYLSKGFTRAPNVVRHIYKVRRGKIHGVKLFQYFDFATCRVEDCFVTDKKGIMLDVVDTNIEVILDQTQEEEEAKPFEF